MKTPTLTSLLPVLTPLALFALSGCSTLRVEPLTHLQGRTEAVVFQPSDNARTTGRTVSVAGLPDILARATWVEGQPFNKGGNWMRFADGREVFAPTGFDFVTVRDTPGHFEIKPEDRAQYRQIMERIRTDARQSL